MIRISLLGLIAVIMVGATVIATVHLSHPGVSPNETISSRFPDGRDYTSVAEQKKPPSSPPALPRAAVGQPRTPPRPPQPRDAVFTDAQIANLKNQLDLTDQQTPQWQAIEASMREVVWDRSQGASPRLEPKSLERFKRAVVPFLATLRSNGLRSKHSPASSGCGSIPMIADASSRPRDAVDSDPSLEVKGRRALMYVESKSDISSRKFDVRSSPRTDIWEVRSALHSLVIIVREPRTW